MIWTRILVLFKQVFDILPQTDEQGTIREVYENTPVRGNNTWMLMCSAMLASIGLDTNSAAVIIGAMLISPLMSPILGVGLSIGINDREMLLQSLRNLGIATLAALGVSFVYFFISPLSMPTQELLARTRPTLLDVGVAFFGGVAGIISISRSDKSIAIPGVAIATALMPPLCTAGFGLATGNLRVFFGAFYLFFLNAVFISLATLLIVKYLKFEVKHYLDKKLEKRVTQLMIVFVFLVSVPSAVFLYNVYTNVRDKNKIETVLIRDMERKHEILEWSIVNTDTANHIKVYSVGQRLRRNEIAQYEKLLVDNGLQNYKLRVVQFDVPPEDLQKLTTDITSNLLKSLEAQAQQQAAQDTLRARRELRQVKQEIRTLFPGISELYLEVPYPAQSPAEADSLVKLTLRWEKSDTDRFKEVQRIREFVQLRLDPDSLALIVLPPLTPR